MKRLNYLGLLLIPAVLWSCGRSVTPTASVKTATSQDNSLLWRIEGSGIQTSYLYGTFHILSQEDMFLQAGVNEAMQDAEQLVLELDMDDRSMQTEMLRHVKMHDDVTLDQLMSDEDYSALNDRLKSIMGVGVKMFNGWMPSLVSSFFIIEVVGGQPASVEESLMAIAKEQDMEILGLETVEDQMNVFHAIPYEQQAESLVEFLHDKDIANEGMETMTDLYTALDIQGLYELVANDDSPGALPTDLVLDQRNMKWIPKIGEYAQNTPTFFAVGAGHLGGAKGVIELLRDAGYTVTPVTSVTE